MHVVLVPAPHIQERRIAPYFPLGVLSLHRVLADAGYDSKIYYPLQDAANPADPEAAIGRWAADIVATQPDWVGFSTMCNSYPLVLLLARAVKQLSPQTWVVLGGPQASVVAEESMAAFPWIDYVVRGEAENAILDLVQVIGKGSGSGKAGSLTHRVNGNVVSTPLVPLLSDLDSLTLPDYQAYAYFREALLGGKPPFEDGLLPFEPGRGCPYGCCFCSTSDYWRRRMRLKSPGLLAAQLEALAHSQGVGSVFLVQDIFAVNKGWFSDFLQAMEACGKVSWGCYLRPDSIEPEELSAVNRAGCRQIFFGVDSGSQRVQQRMGKNLDVSQVCKTVEAAVATGISVTTSLIVGFPWETRQDLQDTLSLHQHFLDTGVDSARIYPLSPLPKTEITTRYASRLRIDSTQSVAPREMERFWNAEMDGLIRRYPQIFSSFYHIETEFVPHVEFRLAAWAGNALCTLSKGEDPVPQARTGAKHVSDSPHSRSSAPGSLAGERVDP